jgi:hypothetical protein
MAYQSPELQVFVESDNMERLLRLVSKTGFMKKATWPILSLIPAFTWQLWRKVLKNSWSNLFPG